MYAIEISLFLDLSDSIDLIPMTKLTGKLLCGLLRTRGQWTQLQFKFQISLNPEIFDNWKLLSDFGKIKRTKSNLQSKYSQSFFWVRKTFRTQKKASESDSDA